MFNELMLPYHDSTTLGSAQRCLEGFKTLSFLRGCGAVNAGELNGLLEMLHWSTMGDGNWMN
jgi:hypothetical protein